MGEKRDEKDAATLATTIVEAESRAPSRSGESLALPPGTVVGRYVIVQDIGRGGMGAVMLAYDTQLARRVAVKILLTEAASEEARVRMMREAQAMARLSHPNVVAIYDVGTFEGNIFLTMEFIDGTTLRGWLATRRPWREVLDVMRKAGRGLAAAHAAGLVHRDFKPSNVLIGKDGRVCVMDFGIARADASAIMAIDTGSFPALAPVDVVLAPEPPTEPSDGPSAVHTTGTSVPPTATSSHQLLSEKLTEEGAVIGTVGYLAPEQASNEGTDARSDVFSFCAAVFRALYGVPPFPSKTLNEYLGALSKPPAARPRDTKVPAWIHPVLLKGLSETPSDRYTTMEELLRALDDDPARRRRRTLLTLGAVAAAVVVALGLGRASSHVVAPVCDGATAEIDEVYGPAVAAEIEQKFTATGAPYAADAWRLTKESLETYTKSWMEAHRRTCEATRVTKQQSEELMSLRMACLEQNRAQLRALVGLLREADRDLVGRAVQASIALPSVDACADITSLMEVKPAPAADKERVVAARQRLAGARAEVDAGRYKAALAKLEPIVREAREIGYEPLVAEALFVMGSAQHSSDQPVTAATTLREAVWMAERGRDERLKIAILLRLASAEVTLTHFDASALWLDFAGASLARRPGSQALEARFALGQATRLYIMGKYTDAVPYARKAVALAEPRGGQDPTTLWESYFRLGSVLMSPDSPEGLGYLERADALVVARFGELHPQRVRVAGNQCVALGLVGRYTDCLDLADRTLQRATQVLPPTHRWIGILHERRGIAQFKLHRSTEALASLDRAVAITKASKDDRELGAAQSIRGDVLLDLGRAREAVPAFDEAIGAFTRSVPADHDFFAAAWKGRGIAHLRLNERPAAIADLEKALEVYARGNSMTNDLKLGQADVRFALAQALAQTGPRPARVTELATLARATFIDAREDGRVAALDLWLAR